MARRRRFHARNVHRRYSRGGATGGGNRSLHPHTYPNGPYGPSGNAITTGHPSTWGWGHNGQVVQQFHPSVQEHWGQYPGGYSHGEPGGPHYGYRHSSLDHNHQPRHLRRRSRLQGINQTVPGLAGVCGNNSRGEMMCQCGGGACLPACCNYDDGAIAQYGGKIYDRANVIPGYRHGGGIGPRGGGVNGNLGPSGYQG